MEMFAHMFLAFQDPSHMLMKIFLIAQQSNEIVWKIALCFQFYIRLLSVMTNDEKMEFFRRSRIKCES